MLEERFLQGSRPSAPVGRAQDAADGVFPDPEARALVPQVPAPSSGSRDPARGVAAPGDRACAADESEPDTSLRPRDERDPRVVGHDDAVLEADAPEDFPQHGVVFRPVGPRDSQGERVRARSGLRLGLFDDGMEDLFDLELAVRAEVGATAPRPPDHPSRFIGQDRPGLGPPRVDSEHVPLRHDVLSYHGGGSRPGPARQR